MIQYVLIILMAVGISAVAVFLIWKRLVRPFDGSGRNRFE